MCVCVCVSGRRGGGEGMMKLAVIVLGVPKFVGMFLDLKEGLGHFV